MAVKGSATVTLTQYRDIQSVTRYYKLRPAGSSAPLKPETKPPSSDWTDSEPDCDISKELYFCDLTIFSNGQWEYSKVSKSSSYEAAKEAYNRAQSAQDSVDEMPNYIASRGENLVTNGTCLLGNNYNFTQFTYDGSDTYYAGGCFKYIGAGSFESKEYIPVDVNSSYELTYYMKCDKPSAFHYDMLRMYDVDKKEILVYYIMFIEGSLTTLAQDLKPGDTTVYLTDASGFDSSKTAYYHKGFIFWNYKNSYGYQYPPETYSRHKYSNLWTNGSTAIDKTNNTITLDKAWTGPTFPAGTSVSQCSDGSTYSYGNDNFYIKTTEWVRKTATWSGVGRNNESHKFREGTAFVRLGWLINYSGAADTINKISTIELTKNAGISKVNNAQSTADNAQSTADTAKANAATAQSTADTAKANAATAQSTADTAKANAAAAQTAANNAQTSADNAQTGVDSLNDSVFGVQTFNYILDGVTIPAHKREDGTYYYILNDEEVDVAESALVHDSDGDLVSYQEGGIDESLNDISNSIDAIDKKVNGFDARENAIYKEIQDNSLIARKNARVTENSLIITNDTTGDATNLLNYLQLNSTSIVIYGNGKDIVTIAKTKDDSGFMEMAGTSLLIAQESRLSTIRLRSADKIGKLAFVAGSDGHVSLREVLN